MILAVPWTSFPGAPELFRNNLIHGDGSGLCRCFVLPWTDTWIHCLIVILAFFHTTNWWYLGFLGLLTGPAHKTVGPLLFEHSCCCWVNACTDQISWAELFPQWDQGTSMFSALLRNFRVLERRKKIINLFFDRTSKCSWFLRSKSCVCLLGPFLFDACFWHSGHLWMHLLCLAF